MPRILFTPKNGGPDWVAHMNIGTGTGYDLVLMLDHVEPTENSGWMLELSVENDGTVSGQITAHPGNDALAIFSCTQDTLRITDNHSGPDHVITDRESEVSGGQE